MQSWQYSGIPVLPPLPHIQTPLPQENLQNPLKNSFTLEIILDRRFSLVYIRRKMSSTKLKPVQELDLDLGTEVNPKQSIQFDNNMFIALHKGTRACIKYHFYLISQFVI